MNGAKELGARELSDDTEIKRILAEHGRLHAIYEYPDQSRLFLFWTTGDFFYLCAHYRNHPNPEDNGFMMWIVDMREHSKEKIIELVKRVTGNGRDWSKPDTGWQYKSWFQNAS